MRLQVFFGVVGQFFDRVVRWVHKRAKSVYKEWLDAKKAELKRREEEQPIQMFFSRILAFFFIAAIIRAAIKGPDPPAG